MCAYATGKGYRITPGDGGEFKVTPLEIPPDAIHTQSSAADWLAEHKDPKASQSPTAESFDYTPLNTNSGKIRLLRTILPRDEHGAVAESTAMPEFDMFHVPLNTMSNPRYDALSYTWGDPADGMHSIRVNGRTLQVQENLFNFLSQLRDSTIHKYKGIKLDVLCAAVWIDALCINQNDTIERNEQVARMCDIYLCASQVLVWLGLRDGISDKAINFISEVSILIKQHIETKAAGGESYIDEETYETEVLQCCDGSFLYPSRHQVTSALAKIWKRLQQDDVLSEWKAVADWFERPYWKRMWVVQELASAPRSMIWCGGQYLDVSHVCDFQRLLFIQDLDGWLCNFVRHSIQKFPDIHAILRSFIFGGPMLATGVRDHLRVMSNLNWPSTYGIMGAIRLRQATDPRDMIYAMASALNTITPAQIVVDYSRSVAEVYQDFAIYDMNLSGTLKIWGFLTEQPSRLEGLASWVPDWTAQNSHHRALEPREYAERSTDKKFFSENYLENMDRERPRVHAAGQTSLKVTLYEHSLLGVKGFMVGTIDKVSRKMVEKFEDDDERYLQEWDDALPLITEIDGTDYQRLLKLAAVLYCNGREKQKSSLLSIKTVYKLIPSALTQYSHHFWWLNDKITDEEREASHLDYKKVDMLRAIKPKMWDRRIFTTSLLRTIGVAPKRAEQGDVLFIPFGCPYVMEIRPIDDAHFEVIGCCYVYGLMHSEAIRLFQEGRLEVREYMLQ